MKRLNTKLEASSVVMLVSIALLLITAGPAMSVAAYSNSGSATGNVSVEVSGGCTLSVENSNHVASLSAGTYSESIGGDSIFTIGCNDGNGYNVYAVGFSGDSEGNTDMLGTHVENKIITGTNTSGSVSNWSFKLSSPVGTTLNSAYTNYTSIPSDSTIVASRKSGALQSYNDSFRATYSAFIAQNQSPDTYTGKVKYTLFHNDNGMDCSHAGYDGPAKFYGGYCWMWDDYAASVQWDAARSFCPSGWYLPSKDQFQILIDNFGTGNQLYNAGWRGNYWSSTDYYNGYIHNAYSLYINSINTRFNYNYVDTKYSVRCVAD